MKLPKKRNEKQKGQILIVFLLVLVVAVAIVLSLASRSFTNVQNTSTSDESNRAYFAAEAGVESALKKISGSTGSVQFTLDFTNVNKTTANVAAAPFESKNNGELFAFPSDVARDDTVQLALLNDFNTLCTGCSFPGSQLTVYWGDNSYNGIPATDVMALEVSLVYLSSSNSDFHIVKWGLDPNGRSNFCSDSNVIQAVATKVPNGDLGHDVYYQYKATINITNGNYGVGYGIGSGPCQQSVAMASPAYPVLLRIRTLYNNASQPIGVAPDATHRLPPQGYIVESSGSTVSGVTRKLQVIQPYPSLPALFDYVLFNGSSSNPLTK